MSVGAEKISNAVFRRINEWTVERVMRRKGVSNAKKIFTYTQRSELHALYKLARACPHGARALEVGSYLGASACYIAAGLQAVDGHLYCVDTWSNDTMPEGIKDTFAEFRKNVEAVSKNITPIRKSSRDLIESDVKPPFHLVFLDGDHTYNFAKHEFETISPWLADTGVLVFHDVYFWEGVSRVVGEALATGKWGIGGFVANMIWLHRAKFTRNSNQG